MVGTSMATDTLSFVIIAFGIRPDSASVFLLKTCHVFSRGTATFISDSLGAKYTTNGYPPSVTAMAVPAVP